MTLHYILDDTYSEPCLLLLFQAYSHPIETDSAKL